MKALPIIIASALFLASAFILYFTWYAVRGRYVIERRRRQRAEKQRKENAENNPDNLRWGVDKHSYCYPKINDTMGYEFITVVKIPEELRSEPNNCTEVERSPSDSWAYAASQGFMNVGTARATTSTSDQSSKISEEETSYPQPDERDPYRIGSINRRRTEQKPFREKNDEDENNADTSINPQDLEDLRYLKEWFNKDVDNLPSDETLFEILEGHPEAMDPDEPDRDEARRIIMEKEELERNVMAFHEAAMEASDDSLDDTFGQDIMNQINDAVTGETEEEENTPGLSEDDIPNPNE